MNKALKIPILYEDEDVMVVDKPSGLLVHPDGRTFEPTLIDWILENRPDIKGVGEPYEGDDGTLIERPGIVHRIDRDTSGALIIAKNQDSFEVLKKQFQDRTVWKSYRLFAVGEIKPPNDGDEGFINLSIARSRTNPVLWTAQRGKKGKEREASTYYRILLRGGGFTYLEAQPKTGRTHQIRVHFKAINYPVVCDPLYGSGTNCPLGFSRLALHAHSVEFKLSNGKKIRVEAPLPKDFKFALKELEKTAGKRGD